MKGNAPMNKITIELCAEDRARLDAIIAGLTGMQCDMCTDRIKAKLATTAPQEPKTEAAEVFTPAEPEKPAEPAVEEHTAPAVTVTHADIQRKVIELSAAGKKDAVRAIVTTYAARVSDIPEDKLVEVLTKLQALEG